MKYNKALTALTLIEILYRRNAYNSLTLLLHIIFFKSVTKLIKQASSIHIYFCGTRSGLLYINIIFVIVIYRV